MTVQTNNHKYNYIFYSGSADYLEPILGCLRSLEDVRIIINGIESNSKLVQTIFKLHWSAKVNRRIKLPLHRIWYKRMMGKPFDNDKPNCYVLLGARYARQNNGEFMDYLRRNDPTCKIVLSYLDLIKDSAPTIEMFKNKADLITTYEKEEAKKFSIAFIEETMYAQTIEDTTAADEQEDDVYFLGYAKNRLTAIMSAYHRLVNAGAKCNFNIVGVDMDKQEEGEGLHYIQPMPYGVYLKNMLNAKCILEVNQAGAHGTTMRTLEAIAYKRKLLTNSDELMSEPFFNPCQMQSYSNANEIDIDFVKRPLSQVKMLDNFDLSPEKRLRAMEELLP